MSRAPVSPEALETAWERVQGQVHRTPVVTSRALNQRVGLSVFLKCENQQKVGAFKARGATNAVRSLRDKAAARGVVTHSSGNHAQALAWAAAERGIPCWVVMPEDAPAVKRHATEGYGAKVVSCAPTVAAREAGAAEIERATGATFIHPYDNADIIAGQSTCARELLEQVGALDAIYVPVGGGGLASGTCLSAAQHRPSPAVWGGEPEGADDAARGLEAGQLVPVRALPDGRAVTIADGLRTQLSPLTFGILRDHLAGIQRVSEEAILEWQRFVMERTKQVVEPSAVVSLAALAERAKHHRGQRVAVVLSGGNTNLGTLFAP